MKAEESEKQSGQPLERPFTSTNAQTGGAILSSDCLLRLHPQTANVSTKPQTTLSSCLLLPYIPLSAQPFTPVSPSQVLGSSLCELCFSFRQTQSCVAQGGLELTEIPLPVSQSPGIKHMHHHSLASSGLALHPDLQASLIC